MAASFNFSFSEDTHLNILDATNTFIATLAAHRRAVDASSVEHADITRIADLPKQRDANNQAIDPAKVTIIDDRRYWHVEPKTVTIPPKYDAEVTTQQEPEQTESGITQIYGSVVGAACADTPEVEFDSMGLPWDSRIHSRTKSTSADGTWKLQRGIKPSVVEKHRAEMRAAQNKQSSAPVAPVVKAAPPPPQAAIPPAPPQSEDFFVELMMRITRAIDAKKLTMGHVTQILGRFGMPDMVAARNFPEMLPAISNAVDEVINK